jgi:hypothetical protein
MVVRVFVTNRDIHIYIYTYTCVCVCAEGGRELF